MHVSKNSFVPCRQKKGAILSPKEKETIMLAFDKTRKKRGIEHGFTLFSSLNKENRKKEMIDN